MREVTRVAGYLLRMGVAPHIARLRAKVGHELLVLPSVAVLPMDEDGRVLLVRQNDFGTFGTVGGAIDADEAPMDAARREAREEIGAEVEITGLVDAIGGPGFRATYPNGDECYYVSIIYSARIPSAEQIEVDDDEVSEARWFSRCELDGPDIGSFARKTFAALGWFELKST